MDLREKRPAVLAEALDQPDLPQRLPAVEVLGKDPCGGASQDSVRSGRGKSTVPQVIGEVEVRVVDPDRTTKAERDEADFLAVTRHERELRGDHSLEVLEPRRRSFEDADTADVHRVHRPLDVQERCVHRAHPVHALTSSSSTSAITRYTRGLTDIPVWLESTSTCSAEGSRHASHDTIPSLRE